MAIFATSFGCNSQASSPWDVKIRIDYVNKTSWRGIVCTNPASWDEGYGADFACPDARFSQQVVLRDRRGRRCGNVTISVDPLKKRIYLNWSVDRPILLLMDTAGKRRSLRLDKCGAIVSEYGGELPAIPLSEKQGPTITVKPPAAGHRGRGPQR